MRSLRVLRVVGGNVRRNQRAFFLSSFGIVVGVATFTFFVALGMGIQAGVLNRIYPVNRIEVEPATVGLVGLRETVLDEGRLGAEMVESLGGLPHVTAVYPKMRSRLQARLWGGKTLFGYNLRTEAFFDGLDPALLEGELQEREKVEEKRARGRLRKAEACKRDEECPLGQECRADGTCGRIEYWRRFRFDGVELPCEAEGSDAACPEGETCLAGWCRVPCDAEGGCGDGGACVPAPTCAAGAECPGVCLPACRVDGDCPETHACIDGPGAPEGSGTCQRLACRLAHLDHQVSDRPGHVRGRLLSRCANGVDPSSPACEPLGCPGDTYCANRDVESPDGFCEAPVPALMSPFLIEVFNSSIASSLGLQPLDGTEAILGMRFRMHLGGSYFTENLPPAKQQMKLAEIVGFSDKALDFGVTLPLPLVSAFNTRFKGRDAARTFHTFLLETEGNEDVSRLVSEVESRGLALSRKSQDARKAADVLFILTVVFSFISAVIMGVAAVNITHNFLTLVTERRFEIGIMRAVGATRRDVRRLVLVEAAFIGLFGSLVGSAVSYAASRAINAAAARYLAGIPFKPDDFFVWDPRVLAFASLFAVAFCLLGAVFPAQRAASLDPARVLAS